MNYCIIIPNYNHTVVIESLIERLEQFNLPIIMVNDGSDEVHADFFEHLNNRFSGLTLISHKKNQGKGMAMQSGFKLAHQLSFTHALQIDADGQHDLNDILKLLSESKHHPKALISGQPVYDESVPKHRFYGRYMTHIWVWIETLSFKIKDSMCGFRVYPLKPTIALLEKSKIGKRMDFDTEVMVKLFWKNIEVRFIPTCVDYPDHGVSHFRPLHDNVLISWMHTRLFFNMLWRSPVLLYRKFK